MRNIQLMYRGGLATSALSVMSVLLSMSLQVCWNLKPPTAAEHIESPLCPHTRQRADGPEPSPMIPLKAHLFLIMSSQWNVDCGRDNRSANQEGSSNFQWNELVVSFRLCYIGLQSFALMQSARIFNV